MCVGKLPSSPLGTSRNLGSSVGVRGRNRAPAPTRCEYLSRRPIYMRKLVRDGFEKSCSGVRSGPHVLVRVCPLAQRRPQIPAPAAAGKFSLFEGAKLKRGASENRGCGVGSGPQSLVGVCPLARTMPRIREPARTAENHEKKSQKTVTPRSFP